MGTTTKISPKDRRQILDNPCHYCGAYWASEIEHVRPRTQGGADALGNLVAACWRCNAEKSGRTPAEWKAVRDDAGKPWPPANCEYVVLELAMSAGYTDAECELLERALSARDSRLFAVITEIHDRYHAGAPAPAEQDQRAMLAVAYEFAAERDI